MRSASCCASIESIGYGCAWAIEGKLSKHFFKLTKPKRPVQVAIDFVWGGDVGHLRIASLAALALATSAAAYAQDTVQYSYDALGRLLVTTISGGPTNGKVNTTEYDAAGNRRGHATGTSIPPGSDAAVFSVVAQAGAVNEGARATFTITKTGPAISTMNVSYTTLDGSAVAPGDYTASSGTLSFRDWETAKTVTIAVADDGVGEPIESFSMQISSPSAGASIGTASAAAQIAASVPANQPPVANANTLTVTACETGEVDVLANDTDPEGNYPLSLVSVGTATHGSAYITYSGGVAKFGFSAGGAAASANVTYVVKDSLGATSTGIVVVHVRGQCL